MSECVHDPMYRKMAEAGGGTGCPVCNAADIERRESTAPLVPVTITVRRKFGQPFAYAHEIADEIREIVSSPQPTRQIMRIPDDDKELIVLSVMARMTEQKERRLAFQTTFTLVDIYKPTGDAALLLAARIGGNSTMVEMLEAALDAQARAAAQNAAAEASGKRNP